MHSSISILKKVFATALVRSIEGFTVRVLWSRREEDEMKNEWGVSTNRVLVDTCRSKE